MQKTVVLPSSQHIIMQYCVNPVRLLDPGKNERIRGPKFGVNADSRGAKGFEPFEGAGLARISLPSQ